KSLFKDVHHLVRFSINIYRARAKERVSFIHMGHLFDPKTVDESLALSGIVPILAYTTSDDQWERRGHARRVVTITDEELSLFRDLYGDEKESIREQPLPVIHSQEVLEVLYNFQKAGRPLKQQVKVGRTPCWDETND